MSTYGAGNARRRTSGRAGAALRALTGLLAGGLVALVLALGAAWFVAGRIGSPGPGVDTLAWHVVGAVAAVLAQRYADRHPRGYGTLSALAVVAVTGAVLTVQWFS